MRSLTDRLFYVVLTLGTLAFAANTARVASIGYTPGYVVDAGTFAALLGVLALRRRLPTAVVFWTLVLAVATLGLTSLAMLGLASVGMMILTAACILVGVFEDLRVAIGTTLLVLLLAAVIGVAHHHGVLAEPPDVARFIALPSTWITQLASFVAYSLAVVFAANSVKHRLTRSLGDLAERTGELERTTAQLRESEQRYRLLADNSTDVVFTQAPDLSMVYFSPSAAQLFGRSMDELQRLGMPGVMTPESMQRAQQMYGHYLALAQQGPVDVPLLEFEYLRADGSTFWGELRVKLLYDADHELVGSQGTLRDISDRRRAEQERLALEERLGKADKLHAIGQLAGGVAHDFNNQLSAIMGFAELIQHDREAAAPVRNHAGSILLAAQRSADLTSQLLTFARHAKHRMVPVDVHAVIAEVVAMLERSIDKRIAIQIRLATSSPVVSGDPSQLASALLNLGLNARDAMPSGGELVFRTSVLEAGDAGEARLEICVSDTGLGMDAETLSHAFEPFYTRKGPGQGTGLGLAAVYGTVQSHRGGIDVDSSPGQGTTFCIRLPLYDAAVPEPAARPATGPPRAGRRATVVVVDDEELVGQVSRLALEARGHLVEVFQNPTAAVAYYRDHWREVDLVLLDMVMPQMTGEEAFAELHGINPDVAVVLTSGYTRLLAVQQLLDLGAREFLAKPFTATELAGTVDRVLG